MSAIMALVLALAGLRTPLRRHPRLRHALWVLVLAKLLTPPVFEFPVLPRASLESDEQAYRRVSVAGHGLEQRPAGEQRPFSRAAVTRPEFESGSQLTKPTQPPQAALQPTVFTIRGLPVRSLAWILFVGIAAAPTGVLLARCVRQMRLVARLVGQAAPGGGRLVRIAASACRRMGLASAPEIRIVACRLVPLLWVRSGRPMIILPAALVERLEDDQIECIVCHELAHFIRRDHWSNAFALSVAALYWWFPIAWWARRELLAAQEQCCDALVILTAGLSRRRYAETLLETIEFVNDERLLLPALASGFGRVSVVRRRFEMIAGHNVGSRFPALAAALALAVGAAFFCLPVRGQGTVDDEKAPLAGADPAAAQPAPSSQAAGAPGPVVEKKTLNYRTAEVTVDAAKHCLNIGQAPAAGQGALRVDLERGVTYTVKAAGEAFMSNQTGADADPFPGVVFFYSTDEEDGYAIRYVVLKPGDSVTFHTPWLISPDDEVFAAAFFLDAWPGSENHGSYTLMFQRGEEAARRAANPSIKPGVTYLDEVGEAPRVYSSSIGSARATWRHSRRVERSAEESKAAATPEE